MLKSLKANTKYVCPGRDFWSSIRRRRERGGRDALGRHAGLSNRQDKPPAEIQTEDLYFQKFSIPCISSDILTYLLGWWLILREGLQNIIQVISSILEGKTISNTTFFVSFHSSSNNIVCSRPHLSVSVCDQSRPQGRALLTVFSSRSFLTRNHRTVGELGGHYDLYVTYIKYASSAVFPSPSKCFHGIFYLKRSLYPFWWYIL